MKTTKRILAILLTFCMLATTLCLPAFATESEASLSEKTATADEIKALLEGDYSLNTAGGVNSAQTVIYMGDNCYRAQATGATGSHANAYCKFLEENGFVRDDRYVTAEEYVGSHLGASGACNQQYANDTYLVTVFWDSVNAVLTVTMEPLPEDADLRAEYLSVFEKPASTEKVCEPVAIQMGLDVENAYENGEQTAGADTPDDKSDDVYAKIDADIRSGMSYVFRLSDGSFVIYDGGSDNAKAYDGADYGDGETVLRKNMYRLLDILNTYAVDKTDIRIAAWIITHPHTDHYKLFEQVVEEMYDPQNSHYDEYANITIERVITNYPSYEQLDNCTNAANSNGACDVLTEEGLANRRAALATCEENGVYLYKAHAGQTYYLADAEIAILYTEEIALTPSGNADCSHESGDQSQGNRLSVISQLTLPVNGYDVKFMITGDAEGDVIAYVNGVYGTALKSDFVQAPHHGNNDTQTTALETFYATNVQAPYLMVPTSEDWWAGNAVNADDADATLLTASGNYTKAYSNTTGVTTFVAGSAAREFVLTVEGGALTSVEAAVLVHGRNDIKIYVKASGIMKLINDVALNSNLYNYFKLDNSTTTFTGTLDGMGHTMTVTIRDRTADPDETADSGDEFTYNISDAVGALFGTLENGTVKNLNIGTAADPVDIIFYKTGGYNPGGLASQASGDATVSNVHLWANLDYTHCTSTTNIGGFFGKVETGTSLTMEDCSVNGTMTWTPETASAKLHGVGGFIGMLNPSAACAVTFDSCVSNMAITDNSTYKGTASNPIGVGGFIGKITTANATVTMTDCVNAGDVTSSMAQAWVGYSGAGGFVGLCTAASSLTMTSCENKGNVTSANICGGLLGNWYTGTATIQYCVNRGSITGTNVGGLVGVVFQATNTKVDVSKCVNTGTVTGSTRAGGIVGVGIGVTTIDYCVNMGAVACSGKHNVGAIYGKTCTATNCYTTVAAEYTGTAGTVTNDSETMSVSQTNEGAGVRIVGDANGSGLRFKFTMDEASMTALQKLVELYGNNGELGKDGNENVQVGAIFLPTDLLLNGELTEENYSNALVMAGSASEVTDGYYYASLVKLYEQHYNTAYSCQSFWRFRTSADGEWITVYAGNTESRTISDIADLFLKDIANGVVDGNRYTAEQLELVNAYAAAND